MCLKHQYQWKRKKIHLLRFCSTNSKENKVKKIEYTKDSPKSKIKNCKFWNLIKNSNYYSIITTLVWIPELDWIDPYKSYQLGKLTKVKLSENQKI